MKNKESGFTLIEILLAMAIVGILSAAIMVSISEQKKHAQANKALAELSGLINPILMCKSDGGTINVPATGGGNALCSINDAYGSWPSTKDAENDLPDFGNYTHSGLDGNTWYYSISNGAGKSEVCCKSKYSKCGLIPETTDCSTVNLDTF